MGVSRMTEQTVADETAAGVTPSPAPTPEPGAQGAASGRETAPAQLPEDFDELPAWERAKLRATLAAEKGEQPAPAEKPSDEKPKPAEKPPEETEKDAAARTFTQRDVDRIVQDRLRKERARHDEQETELADLRRTAGEAERLRAWLQEVQDFARHDPRLAELLNHPVIQGRAPSPEEMAENPAAYAEYARRLGAREGRTESDRVLRETRAREDARRQMATLEAEAKELAADPQFAPLLTEDRQEALWKFIGAHYQEQAAIGARPLFTSLKQALVHLFGDDVLTAVREHGRQQAVTAIQQQPRQLPVGARPGSAPQRDTSRMTTRELAELAARGEL